LEISPDNPAFSEKFKQVLMVAIHKKGQADAYTVFLYNDTALAKPLIKKTLSALTFNP